MIANRDLSCAVALSRIYYVLFSYYSLCTVSLLGDGFDAGGGAACGPRAAETLALRRIYDVRYPYHALRPVSLLCLCTVSLSSRIYYVRFPYYA